MKSSAILCIALILVGLISSVCSSISHKHYTIIYKATQGIFQIEEKIQYRKTQKTSGTTKRIKGSQDQSRISEFEERLNIVRFFPIEATSLLVEGKCLERVRLNESRYYRTAELTLSSIKNGCDEEKEYILKFFYSISAVNYGEDISKLSLSLLSKEDENVKITVKFILKQEERKSWFEDKMIVGFKDIIGNISVLDEGILKYSLESDFYFESQIIKLNHYITKHLYIGFKPLNRLYHRQIESLIMSSKFSYSYFLVLLLYVLSVAFVGFFLFYSQVENMKPKQESNFSKSDSIEDAEAHFDL